MLNSYLVYIILQRFVIHNLLLRAKCKNIEHTNYVIRIEFKREFARR